MSAYLDQLFESYRKAAKAGRDVQDLAASENRDLTPEESEQVDRAFADVTARKAEIERIQNFETLAAAGDAFRAQAAPKVEAARVERREATDMEMFRLMFEDSAKRDFKPSGRVLNTREYPETTLRALQSAGGSAVETSFADFVTVYERTYTPMLNPAVVTVINRTDGSPLVLPRVTADPNHGGTITAEAGGINELDMTASSVQLNPYKYGITNLWSAELGQDNTIGLEDLIGRTTGRELAIDIGTALTTGDGSAKPQGFAAAGITAGTTTAAGTANNTFVGPDDLVDAFYALAAPYRQVATWQASSTGMAKIRKLKTSTGEYLWEASLVPGAPETVLGRPLYENPALAAVASASRSIFVGDFSRYFVARVVPIRVESSIHYKFSTDQIALRTIERVDGDLVDTAAIQTIVSANA